MIAVVRALDVNKGLQSVADLSSQKVEGKEFEEKTAEISREVINALNLVLGKTNLVERRALLCMLEGQTPDVSEVDVTMAAKMTQLRAFIAKVIPGEELILARVLKEKLIAEENSKGKITACINGIRKNELARNIGIETYVRSLIASLEGTAFSITVLPKWKTALEAVFARIKEAFQGEERVLFISELKSQFLGEKKNAEVLPFQAPVLSTATSSKIIEKAPKSFAEMSKPARLISLLQRDKVPMVSAEELLELINDLKALNKGEVASGDNAKKIRAAFELAGFHKGSDELAGMILVLEKRAQQAPKSQETAAA